MSSLPASPLSFFAQVPVRSGCVLAALLWSVSAAALTPPAATTPAPAAPRLTAEASYYGETLTHAGLSVALDWTLRHRAVRMWEPREQARFKRTVWALGAELAAYRHRGNHLGVLAGGRVSARRVLASGWGGEVVLGAGYMHKRLDGVVYEVSEAGELVQTRRKGRPKFAATLAAGAGRRVERWLDGALSWHIRPGVFLEVPHNTVVLPHPFLQVGLRYEVR